MGLGIFQSSDISMSFFHWKIFLSGPHISLLHEAHKLLKNFISLKLMSTDSGLRSWPRGGCSSSTYYCVNLAEGVD